MKREGTAKRGRKISNIIYVLGIIIVATVVYIYNNNPEIAGEAKTVQVGGFEVIPGETTVQDIADQGFDISDYTSRSTQVVGDSVVSGYTEMIDIASPVEGRSYYNGLKMVKEGQAYASLSVVNESKVGNTLASCKVRSVKVYDSDEDAENAVLEGIPMKDLTVKALTEKIGEAEVSEGVDDAGEKRITSTWEKEVFSLEVVTDEAGKVFSFTSSYEK